MRLYPLSDRYFHLREEGTEFKTLLTLPGFSEYL